MTMSAPSPGEPVVEAAADAAAEAVLPAVTGDVGTDNIGRLWLLTITVLVLSLAATVAVLTWQWLGPPSGTVAH